MVSLRLFFDLSHYGPGVDSAFNRNVYQDYLAGVKEASALGYQPYNKDVPIF
jgi:hypothetical protein